MNIAIAMALATSLVMLGLIFRQRRANLHHRHAREMRALVSCLVAWRRAVLESKHRDGTSDPATLNDSLSALVWYVHNVGGADAFTTHIIQVPIGELDEPLFLAALWRIEAVGSIAWALQLTDQIPALEYDSDAEELDRLFPLDGPPAASVQGAELRDRAEIAAKLDEWRIVASAARRRVNDWRFVVSAIELSRAFERARGLTWVLDDALWIDDTIFQV